MNNVASIGLGPTGQAMIEGRKGSAPIAVVVAPGAGDGVLFSQPEAAFLFINLETGIAVGYEGFGQYCGEGARSQRDGIPEAAYQLDYLVTPSLSEAAECLKGLAAKGAKVRGV